MTGDGQMLLGDCDTHKWWQVQKGAPVTCSFSRIKYDQSTEKLAVLGTDVVTFLHCATIGLV